MSNPIDEFVDSLKIDWQRSTCRSLVVAIRKVKPALMESIKWKNPYFENDGAVLKFFVAKNWIDIFVYRGYELSKFQDMFVADENKKMRAIKIMAGSDFDFVRFQRMVEAAIKLTNGSKSSPAKHKIR